MIAIWLLEPVASAIEAPNESSGPNVGVNSRLLVLATLKPPGTKAVKPSGPASRSAGLDVGSARSRSDPGLT